MVQRYLRPHEVNGVTYCIACKLGIILNMCLRAKKLQGDG